MKNCHETMTIQCKKYVRFTHVKILHLNWSTADDANHFAIMKYIFMQIFLLELCQCFSKLPFAYFVEYIEIILFQKQFKSFCYGT